MKINYKRRWEQIRSNLDDRDAFVASLPGNTRYLGNSEAPPGCPPGSTMNYVIIPKKGAKVNLNSENLPLYKKLIRDYEKNELKLESGIIKINK